MAAERTRDEKRERERDHKITYGSNRFEKQYYIFNNKNNGSQTLTCKAYHFYTSP